MPAGPRILPHELVCHRHLRVGAHAQLPGRRVQHEASRDTAFLTRVVLLLTLPERDALLRAFTRDEEQAQIEVQRSDIDGRSGRAVSTPAGTRWWRPSARQPRHTRDPARPGPARLVRTRPGDAVPSSPSGPEGRSGPGGRSDGGAFQPGATAQEASLGGIAQEVTFQPGGSFEAGGAFQPGGGFDAGAILQPGGVFATGRDLPARRASCPITSSTPGGSVAGDIFLPGGGIVVADPDPTPEPTPDPVPPEPRFTVTSATLPVVGAAALRRRRPPLPVPLRPAARRVGASTTRVVAWPAGGPLVAQLRLLPGPGCGQRLLLPARRVPRRPARPGAVRPRAVLHGRPDHRGAGTVPSGRWR